MHFFTGALGKYPFRRGFVNALGGRVMYYSVCSFAGKIAHWEELVSNLAEEPGVRAGCGCKLELRRFLDWEKSEGVLTPKLCNQHKQLEGIPMLADRATVASQQIRNTG